LARNSFIRKREVGVKSESGGRHGRKKEDSQREELEEGIEHDSEEGHVEQRVTRV
jgi:hypothetical protein